MAASVPPVVFLRFCSLGKNNLFDGDCMAAFDALGIREEEDVGHCCRRTKEEEEWEGSQGLGNPLGQWRRVCPLLWQVYQGYHEVTSWLVGQIPKNVCVT